MLWMESRACKWLIVFSCVFSGYHAQYSDSAEPCTYGFVVPESDLKSTCGSYTNQQVDSLQKKVDILHQVIQQLSGGPKFGNLTNELNPNYKCTCDNTTKFTFTFRGR